MTWDAILGYHLNPLTCGVAKFNAELGRRLGIPVEPIHRLRRPVPLVPLVSVKLSEFTEPQSFGWLEEACRQRSGRYDLVLHEHRGGVIEATLIEHARQVYALNAAIAAQVPQAMAGHCPALLDDPRILPDTELAILSFGMAHKVRTDCYRRLAQIVQASGQSYALYLSTALHEGTAFDIGFQRTVDELQQLFDGHVYFLGYLSDVALFNELIEADYCAAFFEAGVRANNSSVHAAMQAGTVVITTLDRHSPAEFQHGETVLDIAHLDALPDDLLRHKIQRRARALNAARFSWDALLCQWTGAEVHAG